ncbi:hypothetical protein HMPREF0493_1649, partial [Lactobacillus amylolyticus DSM 11664]
MAYLCDKLLTGFYFKKKEDIVLFYKNLSGRSASAGQLLFVYLNRESSAAHIKKPNATPNTTVFTMLPRERCSPRSFNSLRVRAMKTFDKQSREYKLLKSLWRLYLKKYDDLDKIHP